MLGREVGFGDTLTVSRLTTTQSSILRVSVEDMGTPLPALRIPSGSRSIELWGRFRAINDVGQTPRKTRLVCSNTFKSLDFEFSD